MPVHLAMGSFNTFELSELDQIMPRLYVRWLLCIPLSQISPSQSAIVEILQAGIKDTLASLPVLQGVVVPRSSDSSRLEVHVPKKRPDFDMKVQNYDSDHDETFPSYESLRTADFPVCLLPDEILTPRETSPLPVFDMIATFIRGGLLLCIKCHHTVVDGGGLGLVVKFLAQNCYVNSGNKIVYPIISPSMDRSILPEGKMLETITDSGFRVVDASAAQKTDKEYASMTSHTFKFNPEVLKRLKVLCSTGSGFISTQDALTAFLYATVSYARGRRFTKTSTKVVTLPSVMGIAVNGRGKLEPSVSNYSGNVTMYATFSSPISLPVENIGSPNSNDLDELSRRLRLPSLASQTRKAITAVTKESIASVISTAASLQDVTRLQPSFANFYQGTDFFITSGADFPVFEQEWWLGGKVDAMRIPFKGNWDGSCAVLATEDKSKGLDVMLGLREDDMAVVREMLFVFGASVA